MKRKVLFGLLLMLCVTGMAQEEKKDKNFLNHLAVGVTGGTPGVGFDVAMPLCHYVQVRAGVAFIPDIKFDTELELTDIDYYDYTSTYLRDLEEFDVEGKVGFTNGKLLFDLFPSKRSSFHLTVGAYFGSSKIVKAYNKEEGSLKEVYDYNQTAGANRIGLELGNYLLEPDADGNIEASIKTKSFKPYVGLGFGRAVPKKRVGFMFEMGVQFWGSPAVYCFNDKLTESDVDGDDGDVLKVMSKITVYPVLNFRLCGRIF